mmetsp:Transcript_8291/g.17241  ORF Transcript_8291/g.17241 Transcript_8291/m.17241 type:complete len:422 (+) Transcript_8291:205-1470(+)
MASVSSKAGLSAWYKSSMSFVNLWSIPTWLKVLLLNMEVAAAFSFALFFAPGLRSATATPTIVALSWLEVNAMFFFHLGYNFFTTSESDGGDKAQAAPDLGGILKSSDTAADDLSQRILDPSAKRLIPVAREDLRRPAYAWPTLALTLLGLSIWAGSFVLRITNIVTSLPLTVVLSCLGTYICFTPMHDACHRAIAPRDQMTNDFVGLLVSAPFFFQYSLFKRIHLLHHRYANDSKLDPDNWAGSGPEWLFPVRWATVFYFYAHYVLEASKTDPSWNSTLIAQFVLVAFAKMTGSWLLGENYFICWVLPFHASTAFLMYFFDYLPHRPHKVPHAADPYKATSVTTFLRERLLAIPMLNQDLHNIHHLYPYLPFYAYSRIWQKHRDELVRRGTRVLPLVLFGGRKLYLSELGGSGGEEKKIE